MSEKHEEKSPEKLSSVNRNNTGAKSKPQEPKYGRGKSLGGFGNLFNTNTTAGRANVAKATYAGIFLTYLYFRAKRGKKTNQSDKISSDYNLDVNHVNDVYQSVKNDDHHGPANNSEAVDTGKNQQTSINNEIKLNTNDINGTNYGTDIKFSTELPDVPKLLVESKLNNTQKSNNVEEIRESAALNKLKRRISQNPRFMDS